MFFEIFFKIILMLKPCTTSNHTVHLKAKEVPLCDHKKKCMVLFLQKKKKMYKAADNLKP